VTFYQAAFGVLPWQSTSAEGMSDEIVAAAIPLGNDVPPAFAVILKRMLSLQPSYRHSMQELSELPFFASSRVGSQASLSGLPAFDMGRRLGKGSFRLPRKSSVGYGLSLTMDTLIAD
jgi:serine/threonine protein kinase